MRSFDLAWALSVSLLLVTGCDGGQSSSNEGGGGNGAGGSGSGASMGTAGSTSSTSTGTPMTCDVAEPDVAGKVTYYDFADGSGACSFDPTPDDLMVGAMNAPQYLASAA